MFYCLQYTVFTFEEYFRIHCHNFSYVTPSAPWHPTPPLTPDALWAPTPPANPLMPPDTPKSPASPQYPIPPEQESSCQEWYYCMWAWHVMNLLVRLLFCLMYPHPLTPSQCPIGRGISWSRVVCNRLSCLLLLSVCNWPFSWIHAVYNIPSLVVKSMSSVLWSSANFCNISQNIQSKAPVALQHWKTNKVVWTWKDDWPPWRTQYHWSGLRCIPLVEASGGQEQYYIRSPWHLFSVWVSVW